MKRFMTPPPKGKFDERTGYPIAENKARTSCPDVYFISGMFFFTRFTQAPQARSGVPSMLAEYFAAS
jgi:hypothetical protein